MPYQFLNLYFLTGTGNSYRAATWVAEAAQAAGACAKLTPIQSDLPPASFPTGCDKLLSLVFPTHGFTAPWLVILFALRLPQGKGTHALVIPTRAGTKLGNLHFPGMEGTAGYLVAFILLIKGYILRGVMGLDMPSNWTALHPGFSPEGARSIIERARVKTASFMQHILSGKSQFRGFIMLFLGLLLVPVSCGYLLIGRLYLSRLFFASQKCNSCELCAKSCPAGAIRMWGKHPPRPYWTYLCESCMRCMNYCPKGAIEVSHSLAIILYFITNISVSVVVLNWIAKQLPALAGLNNNLVQMLLQYIYLLASISLTYWLFSFLIRISWVNRLFTYTTITRFFRRYHEPGTKINDIHR
jgi:Pyruvate/2-oxoacid:ferredoxin oxidoreductase delta subunit